MLFTGRGRPFKVVRGMTVSCGETGKPAGSERELLKRQLFAAWDRDGDHALKKHELLQLARATGYEGTEEEWLEEYPCMCSEKGCKAEDGLHEAAVMELLDDKSDNGCYFNDEELQDICREAQNQVASSPVESPSPSTATPATSPTPAVACLGVPSYNERLALKCRLFKFWDQDDDGFLKSHELLKLARATGYDGENEEWEAEYPQMCKEKGCSAASGMSKEAVLDLLDDDGDDGCYFSDEELREMLAEAGISLDDHMEVDEVEGGSSSSQAPALNRNMLKRKLFRHWDVDKDGRLNEEEMKQVALATEFDGSAEDWKVEFQAMCEERRVSPQEGFPRSVVFELLDDTSDQGAHLPTDAIKRLCDGFGDDGDPETDQIFKVRVKRGNDGKAGYSVRKGDLLVFGVERQRNLAPMQYGDVIVAVDGAPVTCFEEYLKAAHGVKEFSVSIKRPREFEDAEIFSNAKPGYVFKLGVHGLGYYRDCYNGRYGLMTGTQEFFNSRTFQGAWEGFVYKLGPSGLGYYLDKVSRSYLKKRIFRLWDVDKDSKLSKQEALQFARDVGFSGSWEKWQKEYEEMCSFRQCDPKSGLTETAVYDILDDETDKGCFLTSADMGVLIERISKALASTKEKMDLADIAGTSVPLVEIPIVRLKALAKLHNVSLIGCVEKSEIVEALQRMGLQDGSAASMAKEAERQCSEASKGSQEETKERGAFNKKIKLVDTDGTLKKEDAVKMASCVGWVGPDDVWCRVFSEVFKDQGGFQIKEMTIAAVMALAETTKCKLLRADQGVADTGEPPKKKAKVLPPQRKIDHKCEACEKEPKELATLYCTNCKAYLCGACDEENHATKLLKKHVRTKVDGMGASSPEKNAETVREFTSMTVAELKALAKKTCVDISKTVEKKDIISVLEGAGIKPPIEADVKAKAKAKAGPNGVPTKEEQKQGDIRPSRAAQDQARDDELQEMYVEHRAKMAPGSQWVLQTGIALWRTDAGRERTVFINAKTTSGWPSVIEVLEYGSRRIKVRGMGVDRKTGRLAGQKWAIGWIDIAHLVNKDTGELLATPNMTTGKVFEPAPKKGSGVLVLPRKMTQELKEKAAASADPEVGESKPQVMETTNVFSKEASSDY